MNIQEIDKWLDNEYGTSYTKLEELHDYFFEKYTDQKEEIEKLNNIINELEKELINCIKEAKLKWGNQLTDKGYLDIQMTVKNYEDVLSKLQELKGSNDNG